MMVHGAAAPDVRANEGTFRRFLDRLPDDDTDSLLADIYARERQAWVIRDNDIKAVVLTQIKRGPRGRALEITHCAGDHMHLWEGAIEHFADLARAARCTTLEATGRPGWARIGKAHGFRARAVTVAREI